MKHAAARKFTLGILAASIGALLVAGSAGAATINLLASMDGAQANAGAGTGSPGIGSGVITLDTVTNALTWNISWSGLIGAASSMHFHGPALTNQNAGVQVGVGVLGPPVIGNVVINNAQEADLLAGLWYLNLHTSAYPGGEIRGQVLVVPEPTTLALIGAGFLLLAARKLGQNR